MSALFLTETPLSLSALHMWAERRKLGRRGVLDEGLALHHLLDETFGPGQLQPFRLMPLRGGNLAHLYAYTRTDAADLVATARAVALPTCIEVLDVDRMRSLPRPATSWYEGQRLGFDVKLRPINRQRTDAQDKTRHKEVDAFLAEAQKTHPGDVAGMATTQRSREAVYLDWFAARLAPAAIIDPVTTRLAKFQRVKVVRRNTLTEGPEAILHGTLTITDPHAFADALARGIGRHKAYGYGMLLLRPPKRC